ncbi:MULTISPECIES: LytS/YhcK type 5TM receptor domain-containing protein [Clostridium]|uniref:histidine kinase n=1 Tax=Clostridium cadaveris TaxID=1529 RepID=A0A1I2JEL3_9CLOT|nr:LytS/YhcK type 5TM receptor domain-containing protein [Clostridium cadaveris]MDU4953169.1 LytS/YhcK type 5TM receptor domain-containing protein [Clostridium sp.]MDM8311069.1 LytS/YhcK type 5TM receptor domain-containing protein [Clostridium cadaveris]MDY4950118.1 LytS/YhcK type 5TM receptor domain-containing protein [Clostridium cadaveris]NME64146.1 histidine kinase [Clostridium cadaveris]NWK11745.1 histidine kinase [Clostridium cadaveris]
MWELTRGLIGNLGYSILIAFTMSKSRTLQKIVDTDKKSNKDIITLGIIFGIYGIFGTIMGIDYKGSVVNIRNIPIIVSSITFGPIVGGIAGTIAGIHRLIYNMGQSTALACAISTIFSGIASGFLCKNKQSSNEYIYSVFSVVVTESISMILICLTNDDGVIIVNDIFIPMVIINSIGIIIIITIVNSILDEKEKLAGEQARITLDIANKTLPYFKEVNEESLSRVCEIIRSSLGSEFVVLTDDKEILAYSAKNKNIKIMHKIIVNDYTKRVIETGHAITLNNKRENAKTDLMENSIKSSIITPLIYYEKVIGTLKISFNNSSYITERNRSLAEGLSTLISTQLQLGKIKKLEEMAHKAEIRALQTQIHPHFLFNALHTITSFVRINPDMARELIVNLSDYLRFNLEVKDNLIELQKELEQVKAYVAIEKARFGDKIQINYDIPKECMNIKIPPLTIEPLVENAIKHGILKNRVGRNVWIRCIDESESCKIIIEDDGCGIDENIINQIYEETISDNKIGLYNVYSRVKLIYGKAPIIERLNNGTRISFNINKGDGYEGNNSR